MIPLQQIIEFLDEHPDGVTTQDFVTKLGAKPASIAGRLSKLNSYGVIRRTQGPGPFYKPIWKAKERVTT